LLACVTLCSDRGRMGKEKKKGSLKKAAEQIQPDPTAAALSCVDPLTHSPLTLGASHLLQCMHAKTNTPPPSLPDDTCDHASLGHACMHLSIAHMHPLDDASHTPPTAVHTSVDSIDPERFNGPRVRVSDVPTGTHFISGSWGKEGKLVRAWAEHACFPLSFSAHCHTQCPLNEPAARRWLVQAALPYLPGI